LPGSRTPGPTGCRAGWPRPAPRSRACSASALPARRAAPGIGPSALGSWQGQARG